MALSKVNQFWVDLKAWAAPHMDKAAVLMVIGIIVGVIITRLLS